MMLYETSAFEPFVEWAAPAIESCTTKQFWSGVLHVTDCLTYVILSRV